LAWRETSEPVPERWQRFPFTQSEKLGNAIFGGGLEAVQLSGPDFGGSLAYHARDGIVFSSGLVLGKVEIRGRLPQDTFTFGLIVQAESGSGFWLNRVPDGTVGVLAPGSDVDAILTCPTLYITASLTREHLERKLAALCPSLPPDTFGEGAFRLSPLDSIALSRIRQDILRIHNSRGDILGCGIGADMLSSVLKGLASEGRPARIEYPADGRAHTAHLAREFIRDNLTSNLTTQMIAAAAGVPARSLYRAFPEVIGETPQSYLRKLRLNRIRCTLLGASEGATTVKSAARRWRVDHDLGRLSGRYLSLFGELPSETISRCHARKMAGNWM